MHENTNPLIDVDEGPRSTADEVPPTPEEVYRESLLNERAGYEKYGRDDRVAMVDAELERLGEDGVTVGTPDTTPEPTARRFPVDGPDDVLPDDLANADEVLAWVFAPTALTLAQLEELDDADDAEVELVKERVKPLKPRVDARAVAALELARAYPDVADDNLVEVLEDWGDSIGDEDDVNEEAAKRAADEVAKAAAEAVTAQQQTATPPPAPEKATPPAPGEKPAAPKRPAPAKK